MKFLSKKHIKELAKTVNAEVIFSKSERQIILVKVKVQL